MKKFGKSAALILGTAMCIGLCGGCTDKGNDPRGLIDEDGRKEDSPSETVEISPTPADIEPVIVEPDPGVRAVQIDRTSKQDILDFLSGEWTLIEEKSGKELGIFTIGADGSCEYRRNGVKDVCTMTLDLKQDHGHHVAGLDQFELSIKEMPGAYTGADAGEVYPVGSKGYLHIAQSAGADYLYMEETGNGASEFAYFVFNDPDSYDADMKWIFSRNNEVTETEGAETADLFYAMLWANSDNGVLLQKMDAVSFDAEQEYTGYRYTGAVFDESHYPEAVWYGVTDDPEISLVFDDAWHTSVYPAKIYMIGTDDYGNVSCIEEVDGAAYGEYMLASGEQDISYEGTTFKCNGFEYELEELGNVGNMIMDCTVIDDNAVIEAHLNPHRSIYTIFNMRSMWPTETISAGQLLFGDDIWDYFSSDMNAVFDRENNLIHEVDGTEIVGLSFTDDGKQIKVEYWKDDSGKVYEDYIDRPGCLNAPVYAFANYKRVRTVASWRDYMSYAPEGALFMVMVNPPSDDVWDFHQPMPVGDGGTDSVYVISLQDDTTFTVSGSDAVILNKGDILHYNITVPEGMAQYIIYAATADGRYADWPVETLSGKEPLKWAFASAQ